MLSTVRSFDLVLLEEGEEYVSDAACNVISLFPLEISQSNWNKFMGSLREFNGASNNGNFKGRIRVGTKSLIFEPDPLDLPILKLHFQHITAICDCSHPQNGIFVSCRRVVSVPTAVYNGKTRFVSAYDFHVVKGASSEANAKLFGTVDVNNSDQIVLPSFCFVFLFSSAESRRQQLNEFRRLWECFKLNLEIEFNDTIPVGGFSHTLIPTREKPLLGCKSACSSDSIFCWRLKRMVRYGGFVALTDRAIYFQPCPNFSRKLYKRMAIDRILHVFRRDSGLPVNRESVTALEIISLREESIENISDHTGRKLYRCLYLEFKRENEREQFITVLKSIFPRAFYASESRAFRQEMTQLWRHGALPNFQYLDFLNCIAGRSRYDLSHYPIFPWVISDYESAELDLSNPRTFRDLSKPVGALNSERLKLLKRRMSGLKLVEDVNEFSSSMNSAKMYGDKPTEKKCSCGGDLCNDCLLKMWDEGYYLYGSHYSTPALIVFFLIRLLPECQLRLYGGRFDAAARTFKNISETFSNVLNDHSSYFELTPEFYESSDSYLRNCLNITTQYGRLGDVELPPWANNSSSLFLRLMRGALESECVSNNLPQWIDLIFGYKQAGIESIRNDNVFHPISYLASVHAGKLQLSRATQMLLKTMDPKAVAVQVGEFGQSPIILFDSPHPKRLKSPVWKIDNADSIVSAPWFIYMEKHAELYGRVDFNSSEGFRLGRTISQGCGNDHLRCLAGPNRTLRTIPGNSTSSRVSFVGFVTSNTWYSLTKNGSIVFHANSTLDGSQNVEISIGKISLTCAAVSSGSLFACSSNGLITICDLPSLLGPFDPFYKVDTIARDSRNDHDIGRHLIRVAAHSDGITCVDFNDGFLTTGGIDETVRQFEQTESGIRLVGVYDEQNGPLTGVCSKIGLLLSATVEGNLMLWDTRSPHIPIWSHDLRANDFESSQVLGCGISNRYIQLVRRSGFPVVFWDVRMLNSLNSSNGFRKRLEMPNFDVFGAHCDAGDCVALCGVDSDRSILAVYDLHTGDNVTSIPLNNLKYPTLITVNNFGGELNAVVANTLGEAVTIWSNAN